MATRAASDVKARAAAVLDFWFEGSWTAGEWVAPEGPEKQAQMKRWYQGSKEFDQRIRDEFKEDIDKLGAGGYKNWSSVHEQLAAVILADQFTRNAFRGTPQMFSLDPQARSLTKSIVADDGLKSLHPPEQQFALMPLMHSEELEDHKMFDEVLGGLMRASSSGSSATEMYTTLKKFLDSHTEVIKRFGRFPHRNKVLGRENTPEEDAAFKAGEVPSW